ncbi:lysosome membrane protein 2 isoform X1 [Bombyx mori]|nr:lysosome membrane protein 2 isoform X2 [Bombyx mori]
MVIGAKITLQNMPSKGHVSLLRLQSFTVEKRHSLIKLSYGSLLILTAIVLVAINPIQLISDGLLVMKEGSFLYTMWEAPPYQVYSEIHLFNYTNVEEYISGAADKLKVQEVGPFRFLEIRTNENITVDEGRGVMTMKPKLALKFLRDQSVGDLENITIVAPNIALLALSTLAADKLPYWSNAGAYYSIKALGVNLFRNLTANEILWGYYDPLVSIANTLLPGWIDFSKLGILDRFYAERDDLVEVELGDASRKYSINSWNGSPGLLEQGFTDLNTSSQCNTIQGTYEGLMITPNHPTNKDIPVFRKQGCRIFPFSFHSESSAEYGFNVRRYELKDTAFNRSSPYVCKCKYNCLPDGFVDVSRCYYGFPIALSKAHLLDVDPAIQSHFEGMKPDPAKHSSFIHIEPTIGAPLAVRTTLQVNIAVRMSEGNPITKPLQDKVMPLMLLSLSCETPPPSIIKLLRLKFVIGPALLITFIVFLFAAGVATGIWGFYRIFKPKYKLLTQEFNRKTIEKKISMERRKSIERRRKSFERRKSSMLNVVENLGLVKVKEDLAKEAVSLLGMSDNDDLV